MQTAAFALALLILPSLAEKGCFMHFLQKFDGYLDIQYSKELISKGCKEYSDDLINLLLKLNVSEFDKTCKYESEPTCKGKIVCPARWVLYSHDDVQSCFHVRYLKTFKEGEESCQKDDAHLASIHSANENEFIRKITRLGTKAGHSFSAVFLGGISNDNNTWTWTDGSEFNFEHWAKNRPNSTSKNQCISFYTEPATKPADSSEEAGFWNNFSCEEKLSLAVCKKKPKMML